MSAPNPELEPRFPVTGKGLRKAEFLLLLVGLGLLGVFLGAHLHAFLFSRVAMWRFKASMATTSTDKTLRNIAAANGSSVDFSLWGDNRIKAYKASLAFKLDDPIAVLNIPRLHLAVPVFDGTDDITLNRGLGRIAGTGAPGENGNLGIAGHRDGFFRGLKDIGPGDLVEIETPGEKDTYIVDGMEIVDPKDVSVLRPGPATSITLVTCYPFYFVGDAPHRFIVKASLRRRDLLQQARALPPEPLQTEKEK